MDRGIQTTKKQHFGAWAWVLVNTLIFTSGILLNLWGLQRISSKDASVLQQHSPKLDHRLPFFMSPLADYNLKNFDAELGTPSIFKGEPRKELDDAWRNVVDQPMILVDRKTLSATDPTTKPTKGTDGHYYATVEVYHQLHCLDITRKYIWRDYYQDVDTFQDPPDMLWEHIDHCIDLLRQVLMCNADLGLIFYTDVGMAQPVARVSTPHMCRNMSAITEWVQSHDSELGIYAEDEL